MKIFKILTFLLFALMGCATVTDLRSLTPYKTMESPLSPKEIASCVNFKAPEETHFTGLAFYEFHLSENPPGTYYLLARTSNQPLGEAVFKSNGNGGTLIEFRNLRDFWAKDAFWACIQQCASPKTPPENTSGK